MILEVRNKALASAFSKANEETDLSPYLPPLDFPPAKQTCYGNISSSYFKMPGYRPGVIL